MPVPEGNHQVDQPAADAFDHGSVCRQVPGDFPQPVFFERFIVDHDASLCVHMGKEARNKCLSRVFRGCAEEIVPIKRATGVPEDVQRILEGNLLIGTGLVIDGYGRHKGFKIHEVKGIFKAGLERIECGLVPKPGLIHVCFCKFPFLPGEREIGGNVSESSDPPVFEFQRLVPADTCYVGQGKMFRLPAA